MGWASRFFLLAAIAVSAPAIAVHAEGRAGKTAQDAPSPAFEKCLDTGDARLGIMPALFDCNKAELSRKNEALNDAYRAVRKNLILAKQKQLQVSERRWIAGREKRCNAEADKEGGLGYQDNVILWYGCMISETDRRIAWLKDFARKS